MDESTSIIQDLVRSLTTAASQCGQRRLLVLSGEKSWCFDQAAEVVGLLNNQKLLWVGEQGELPALGCADLANIELIKANKTRERLGREHQHIIFDAFAGFDVDAFGAISGTLCAGGLFVLLVPPLNDWRYYADPEHRRMQVYPQSEEAVSGWYLQRLSALVRTSDQLSLWCQSGEIRIQQRSPSSDIPQDIASSPYKTLSQQQAVEAIHKVVRGHRRRPLVMTADRGRGKSAALGIAAAQLLKEGLEQILITAPARKTADVFFFHLQHELGNNSAELMAKVRFISPDDLIRTQPETSFLLVDEAAAIPTPLLEIMLQSYSRLVYATTVHGYEGTGRGFAIRFKKILNEQAPQWQETRLTEPVRWRAGDPLEAFVFSALLLNAAPVEIEDDESFDPKLCQFRELSPQALIADETLLQQLFGLLVLAHYQTSPFDLRQLLDGGNISTFGLFSPQRKLVGVLLAAREGGIEPELQDGIWLGQRRVRGHLLPQSLSNHLGLPDAIALSGMRVIRIAVHPDCQRSGLGKEMLIAFQDFATEQGVDYLGTLYGVTKDLLTFWSDSGYEAVRVGLTRDSASGTHSAMMLKPISAAGSQLVAEAKGAFIDQFHWLLMDELRDFDPELVAALFKSLSDDVQRHGLWQMSERDWQELYSFCEGQRQYENCVHAIKKAIVLITLSDTPETVDVSLLVRRVLQNQSWASVVRVCDYSGEKQGRVALREAVKILNAKGHLLAL
ncbi:tRNA(Met) cytidine acetyltransferase TmcA [Endozoicomonas ascidiicola]|uniref:tRNA(Met) cytidine acetyltransferase TmcA n=1 Tax=Endozoicomonas ascidiicola TaxID=1698521 RepID=UPI000A7BB049|nr:GNAT family N-acetyltransferase [Endozoicomonas ascidiicola]